MVYPLAPSPRFFFYCKYKYCDDVGIGFFMCSKLLIHVCIHVRFD